MTRQEVRLEQLLGRRVLDAQGKAAGRVQEVRAERQGDEWVVREYLLGPAALLERFSAWGIGMAFLRLLGAHKGSVGYRVPWEQLDLSDPARPRLRCTCEDLEELPPRETDAG